MRAVLDTLALAGGASAAVDGARGGFDRFRLVTWPMLGPVTLFVVVITTIRSLRVFDTVAVLTQGGPNNASLLYVLYLYRKAFQESEMGYASALAWVLFVIIAVLSFFVLRTSGRWVYYEGGER